MNYDQQTLTAIIQEGRKVGYQDDFIAAQLSIQEDDDVFFLATIEAQKNDDPDFLHEGQRIRALVPSVFGWQGEGMMTSDQSELGEYGFIQFRPDGAPDDGLHDDSFFLRYQVAPVTLQ